MSKQIDVKYYAFNHICLLLCIFFYWTINGMNAFNVTDDKVGKLQEEAEKRKNRLKALKEKTTGAVQTENKSSEIETVVRPLFRSYKPQDSVLQKGLLPKAQPGDINSWIEDTLESVKNEPMLSKDLSLGSLAPRKPDWDLKRDVAKRLEQLERRTQRAIAELIRENLKEGKGNLDVAVDVGASANALGDEDDDD